MLKDKKKVINNYTYNAKVRKIYQRLAEIRRGYEVSLYVLYDYYVFLTGST